MRTDFDHDPVVGEVDANYDLAGGKHADGWERATDAALQAAANKWPKPSEKWVVLQHQALVSVTNPGTIDTYRVILVPAG